MKIQNIQLKKVNITALFDKIDQSLITSEAIRDLFDLKAPERADTPFIELPGTKVLIIPVLKIEVVIEPNRLRVSNTSTDNLSKSRVMGDFKKVFKAFSGKSTLRAYGYNYDISLQLQKDISYDKLLSPNLKRLVNKGKLLEAGARVSYSKAGRKFDIQIVPSGQEKQLTVYGNVHYEATTIDFTKSAKKLLADYKEIEQAISNFAKG